MHDFYIYFTMSFRMDIHVHDKYVRYMLYNICFIIIDLYFLYMLIYKYAFTSHENIFHIGN